MGPLKAISLGIRKVFLFSGRASRSEYWWMLLASFVLVLSFQTVAASLIIGLLGPEAMASGEFTAKNLPLGLMFSASVFLFSFLMLPTVSRRFKDHGWRGGWFYIAAWINGVSGAGVLLCTLLFLAGYAGSATRIFLPFIPLSFIPYGSVLWCFWIGFVRPENGPNQYGANPAGVAA
ncbi:DUF805 domain-containing protein [Ruegeria sp. 2205SS24-7]|uniref:DUF805 domain-containing protein n=1 Tax=Ruegeria discodermiae TaxID=3064389 RepID=UPI0027425943|nr:DUF805 domain-containing protein [Ruegeria sp. 2205SS24-7]MDP5217445.1 DUF805 domain-containing protein [Ruegeria sp. 2205SS24-7]